MGTLLVIITGALITQRLNLPGVWGCPVLWNCREATKENFLSLELQMVDVQISVGQPVKVKLVFRNPSAHPIVINGEIDTWGDAGVKFDIKTPSGSKPEKHYTPARKPILSARDFEMIMPGGTRSWDVHVTTWYQIKEPGQYSMRASYLNTNDGAAFNLPAWVGTVSSNTVSFTVVQADSQ